MLTNMIAFKRRFFIATMLLSLVMAFTIKHLHRDHATESLTQVTGHEVSSGTQPAGFGDSFEEGWRAALGDIEKNRPQFGLYGRFVGSSDEFRTRYGLTPIFLGCVVGGPGSSFWRGYNQAVVYERASLGFEVPEVLD